MLKHLSRVGEKQVTLCHRTVHHCIFSVNSRANQQLYIPLQLKSLQTGWKNDVCDCRFK